MKKIFIYIIIFLTFVFSLISISHEDTTSDEPPFDLQGRKIKYIKNMSYGDDPSQSFDIFIPKSRLPVPLVIFIHGGGFNSGDKNEAWQNNDRKNEILYFLDSGIAYATINYRFLSSDKKGILKSMMDSAYCLQFIRYNAKKLNIQKENIALYGNSAGAGTSFWLGVHDDMAQQNNINPVLRESTRVKAVGLYNCQATYDLKRWEEILKDLNWFFYLDDYFSSIYCGVTDLNKFLNDNFYVKYRSNLDMLALMDKTDADIYISSLNNPNDISDILHHPYHSSAIYRNALKSSITVKAYIPKQYIDNTLGESMAEFFANKLLKKYPK